MTDNPTRIDMATDPTKRRFRGVAYHGNTPFDVPYISPVYENLWQGGCETGLVLPTNIKHLVSLYPWEHYEVRHNLGSRLEVTMHDSEEQSLDQVYSIASWIHSCMQDGPTLVHCQAGLNRSAVVTAMVLMLYKFMTADEAISHLRQARSPAVLCNPAFEEWLRERT